MLMGTLLSFLALSLPQLSGLPDTGTATQRGLCVHEAALIVADFETRQCQIRARSGPDVSRCLFPYNRFLQIIQLEPLYVETSFKLHFVGLVNETDAIYTVHTFYDI